MNPDFMFPTVTAIVRYDLFPYYRVAKGKLKADGGIDLGGAAYYRPESVIQILPISEYDSQKETLQLIESEYREKERQLRIDILKCAGVKFVTVK